MKKQNLSDKTDKKEQLITDSVINTPHLLTLKLQPGVAVSTFYLKLRVKLLLLVLTLFVNEF